MSKKKRKQYWQGGMSMRAKRLLAKLPRLEESERRTQARLDEAQEAWNAVPYHDMKGERQARGRVHRLTHNLGEIQESTRKVKLWLKRNPWKVATVTRAKKGSYPKYRKRKDDDRCQWWYPTGGRCWRKAAAEGGRFCEEHEDAYARLRERDD